MMYRMSCILAGMLSIPLIVSISIGLMAKLPAEYIIGLALGSTASVAIPLILIGHSYDGKGPIIVNRQPSEAVLSRGFYMEVDETPRRSSSEKEEIQLID